MLFTIKSVFMQNTLYNKEATPSLTRVGIDDIVFAVTALIIDPFIESGERFVLWIAQLVDIRVADIGDLETLATGVKRPNLSSHSKYLNNLKLYKR